jgi:arylsulfatase A-like enzyme
VVLISIDTLRADRLNCYGYKKRLTSPNIDALAKKGVVFENCYAQSPGTLSSQMSLLTGYYPTAHGITYKEYWELSKKYLNANQPIYYQLPAIDKHIYTLAEILKVHGFQTLGIHEGAYLSAPVGYSLGFDRFICTQSYEIDPDRNKIQEGLNKTFSQFVHIAEDLHEPFFLFFHTYEVHSPYIHTDYAIQEAIPPQQGEYFSACYDGGVLYTDKIIGELFGLLEKKDLLDHTIVILTSDHGEEFGDHYPIYYSGHGQSLYKELVHVPLIIYDKILFNGKNSGERISTPVESIGIVPTILDMVFGNSYASELLSSPSLKRNGRSVLRLCFSEDKTGGDVYMEDSYYGPERIALITQNYKYILIPNPKVQVFPDFFSQDVQADLLKTPAQELFAFADNAERINLCGGANSAWKEIERKLLEKRKSLEVQNKKLRGNIQKIDDVVLQELKSLGYIK